ncbi:MAG: hypothetical protein JWL72_3711, partial [Ilumatobacteraceae bacterium]|nr:hypothetical protein [Ilumatobacteraceae bacterium]
MTALDVLTRAGVDVDARPRVRTTQAMRPHVPVLAGQALAGAGNLVFAVCAAKVLGAGDYADVVAFLALYLLLHVPASALSAAGSLAPNRIATAHRTVLRVGLAVGVGVAALSEPISHTLGLPVGLVIALAVAAPGAGLLGLERGLAYGRLRQRPLIRSLITEPAVRIVVGIALAVAIGPLGAAIGTVLAGYGALWVCSEGFNARAVPPPGARTIVVDRHAPLVVALSFVMVAVIQSVDLIIANRVLDSHAAAQFAVLSTLGGAAVFATATIPMVLMPVLTSGRERAASAAIGLTVGVG